MRGSPVALFLWLCVLSVPEFYPWRRAVSQTRLYSFPWLYYRRVQTEQTDRS